MKLEFGDPESIRLRNAHRVERVHPWEMSDDELIAYTTRLLDDCSAGPWMADIMERFGDNWLIGSFGRDHKDVGHILTTYHVHASEKGGDAQSDAEFCAAARELVPRLLKRMEKR